MTKKLPLLLACSISSLFADIVTVNLTGLTTGDWVITQNSYSGTFAGLPADYFSTGATVTTFGTGTVWTAQFTYDTVLMPAATQSDITGLNGGDPITTHHSESPAQWATVTFNIGAFSFSSAMGPLDTPPVPTPSQTLSYSTPLNNVNSLAYGDTIYNAQGFHGASFIQNGYGFVDENANSISFSHFGGLFFSLYQDNAEGPLFSGSGVPTSFSYADTGLPFPASHYSYAYGGFNSVKETQWNAGSERMVDTNYISAYGADLTITSAFASTSESPVPEPSTLALGAMGAALLGFRRLRRH